MTNAADHREFARYHGHARDAAKHGLLRRMFDRFMQSRQRQADSNIARFIAASGGPLTDSVERNMMKHLSRSSFGNRD
jgi:hypothetical protein